MPADPRLQQNPGAGAGQEIARGDRFAFGENWSRFLTLLDAERIRSAEMSLRTLLQVDGLQGQSFLDIGCGSGLFSLVARRLGARVHSFDYDADSVACARELRRRYQPDDPDWCIEAGSVLDPQYMDRLGTFDIVYSWGVLHHTGRMWDAIDAAGGLVRPGGRLCIAVYNHQPLLTPWWRLVKRGYLRVPPALRAVYVLPFFGYAVLAGFAADVLRGTDPRSRYLGRGRRGMSPWYDMVDWVGGWPFETATPHQVVAFARDSGFEPLAVRSVGRRHGCNEFLFQQVGSPPDVEEPCLR
jgi:SAM-dependent methyltransferase